MTELGDRNRRVPLRLRSGFRHAAQILRLRSGQALRKRLNLEWSVSFLPAWRLPAVVNLVEIFFPDNSPESPIRMRAKRAMYVTAKNAVTSRGTPRSFDSA